MAKSERRTIRVKPYSYQPSKAELEEPITLPTKPDGTPYTLEEVVHAITRPVNIIEDPDA